MLEGRKWVRPGLDREALGFGLAFVALLLLGAWWATLLGQTIEQELRASELELELRMWRAAADPELRLDADLEVLPRDLAGVGSAPLAEAPDRAVRVRGEAREAVERLRSRRVRMVAGETTLLVALFAVIGWLLVRFVRATSAAQREMGLFVGQVTHEMKTPLAGLRALLETLQRGRVPPEELPDLLALGLEQVEREEHLVQTLLQAQRLRVEGPTLAPVELPVAEVLEDFRGHRRLHGDGQLAVEVGEGTAALADRDALWTILENLVDNAFKNEARRVVLRVERRGDAAEISCSDDGRGFPPQVAEQIFEPFRSGHGDGATSHSSGLGLHICRRLARAMGGELRARSDGPGLGATFTLRLPAR